MRVAVCGPNLRDQTKGDLHVHTADCGDLKHYGDGARAKFGGEGPHVEAVESVAEVVYATYADQIAEGAGYDDCLATFWFAPCTAGLPQGDPS